MSQCIMVAGFQAGKWSSLLRGLELGIENLYGLIRFEGKLLDKEKIWDIGVCGRSCGNLSVRITPNTCLEAG